MEGINPEFELEITKIRKFAEPELNEEFFKMAFPQGGVTDEAGLDKFIDAQIEAELRRESDYLFTLQVRDYLVKKSDLKMPAAFLKRWLYTINEGKFSMEDIEKDFDQFLKMFTWNYLQKHFIKTDGISVSKEEGALRSQGAGRLAVCTVRHALGAGRHAGGLRREDSRRQGSGPEDLREAL